MKLKIWHTIQRVKYAIIFLLTIAKCGALSPDPNDRQLIIQTKQKA
jgi:hypothetical protein